MRKVTTAAWASTGFSACWVWALLQRGGTFKLAPFRVLAHQPLVGHQTVVLVFLALIVTGKVAGMVSPRFPRRVLVVLYALSFVWWLDACMCFLLAQGRQSTAWVYLVVAALNATAWHESRTRA